MHQYFQRGTQAEVPTLVLQRKSGEPLGVLDGAADMIYKKNLNGADELSFLIHKYLDGKLNPLWNDVTDLKNVYIPEFQERFEIRVSFQEESMETKAVTGTSLCEAELGQIILRGLEINTDQDLASNSSETYPATVFYMDISDNDSPETRKQKEKHSLLHRVLSDKASFYQIGHVDASLKNLSYTFSADGTSIYDFLTGEVAKQMQCLFQFDSITRHIHVYALSDNDSTTGYGKDTAILIDRENLASSLTCEGDADSLKNCFYVEGGDELINAAFAQLNPSGDQYLYYFSPEALAELPQQLRDAISQYHAMSENYLTLHPKNPSATTHKYQQRPDTDKAYMVSDTFDPQAPDSRYLTEFQKAITDTAMLLNPDGTASYNKYYYEVPSVYSQHSDLVTAYYNALDFQSFLEYKMMPDYKMEVYDKYQALSRLNADAFGTIGIAGLNLYYPSETAINNAIANKAKTLINTGLFSVSIDTFQVTVDLTGAEPVVTWTGAFSITDRQEEDPALSTITNTDYRTVAAKENYSLSFVNIPDSITLTINDDAISYAKNSIASMLAKKDLPMAAALYSPDVSETDFEQMISYYGMGSLTTIQNVLTDCLGIISKQLEDLENSESEENELSDKLTEYQNLYANKLALVSSLISTREAQLLAAEKYILLMEAYLSEVKAALDFKEYLTSYNSADPSRQNLWEIFQYYRREGEYRNDNIISDGLKDNASLVSHAQKLMELASKELEQAGTMQYRISTTMDNLLALPEFAPVLEDFDVGNWIRVRMDVQDKFGREQIYKLRLLSYQINFDQADSSGIQVEFSTSSQGAGGVLSDVEDILNSAQSMAKSYGATVRQSALAVKASKTIDHWISDGLDLTKQNAISDIQNQSLVIDSSGLLARKQDPLTETYDDCQLRIINNGIYTTHDNWDTMDAALGKFWYKDPNKNWQPTETYGIIAHKLVGEQVLGEDLRICNRSGTMEFSDYGLTISNGVNTISFQPDAGTGSGTPGRLLAITSEGSGTDPSSKDLLYTDTQGNLNITGNLLAEQISTNSGKFWVDSNGILHASDAVVSGTVTAKDGTFTGTVNATGGSFAGNITCTGTIQGGTIEGAEISGGSINVKDVFTVDGNGCLVAKNAAITGNVTATAGTFTGTVNATGGTFTGDIICKSTIKGAALDGGRININNEFTVDDNGKMYANNAEISGNINAKNLQVHKSYWIYDPDFQEEKVKIISTKADNTSDTELCIGRLTKNDYDSPLNYISFKDSSQERSMFFRSDMFIFSTGGSGRITLWQHEVNSDSSTLKLSTNDITVVVKETSFRPSENDAGDINLGSTNCCWKQIYCTKSSITTSDANSKEDIQPISQKYEKLFDLVAPVTYRLKSSGKITHDRIHIGAISQQVESAMEEAGLRAEELSFFCKDENPDGSGSQYALRYQEWIMMNTHMLQKTRRELQEANHNITILQQEIAELKASIKNLQEVNKCTQPILNTTDSPFPTSE